MTHYQIKSITFTVLTSELENMSLMPPNPSVTPMSHMYLNQRRTWITYDLKHPPSTWFAWQQLGAIYLQIKKIFPSVVFEITKASKEDSYSYTLEEFSTYFNRGTIFPTPYYPQAKTEYMSRLTIYAQKLHYNDQYLYEILVAMGIRFNDILGRPFSYREVFKKASSIYKLDTSDWKVRKGQDNSNLNKAKKETATKKALLVKETISMFIKKNGKIDFKAMSEYLDIPVRSLRRYASQDFTSLDHITKECGTKVSNTVNTVLSEGSQSAYNIQTSVAQNEASS
jgi:hypothetical protein